LKVLQSLVQFVCKSWEFTKTFIKSGYSSGRFGIIGLVCSGMSGSIYSGILKKTTNFIINETCKCLNDVSAIFNNTLTAAQSILQVEKLKI